MGFQDSPREEITTAAPQREHSSYAQPVLESLFEFSPDGLIITDGQGVMRDVNRRAAEMFGYTVRGTGRKTDRNAGARSVFAAVIRSHRENYNAHPRARQMGAAMNLYGLRKDGSGVSRRHHAQADREPLPGRRW